MMVELTSNEVDEVMSEIGIRVANQVVGKPIDDDDIDDILIQKLGEANDEQRYEVVDIMLDVLAVADILRLSLADDHQLDADETEELVEYLGEIEEDTKAVIKDLVNGSEE
jgi:hypothetical protein